MADKEKQKYYKTVGARIKQAREKKGLSREYVAEKSGLSTQTIRMLESGQRSCRCDTLASLCRVLGETSDYILGIEYRVHNRIGVLAESLNETDQQFVERIIVNLS